MEPRLRSRGSSSTVKVTSVSSCLQWSRGCEAAEARSMLATSVPLMLLQWSRGCEAAEAPPIVTLLLSRNCNPLCEHLTIFRITHETNRDDASSISCLPCVP